MKLSLRSISINYTLRKFINFQTIKKSPPNCTFENYISQRIVKLFLIPAAVQRKNKNVFRATKSETRAEKQHHRGIKIARKNSDPIPSALPVSWNFWNPTSSILLRSPAHASVYKYTRKGKAEEKSFFLTPGCARLFFSGPRLALFGGWSRSVKLGGPDSICPIGFIAPPLFLPANKKARDN